jgi:5-methylcytosine-specific restriction protein B
MSIAYIIKVGAYEDLIKKIKNKENFTFEGIYNFVEDIKVGDKIFIYFGGDKVPWAKGLAGYGVVSKDPYDKKYDGKNYRIDIQPQVILDEPISPKESRLHAEYGELFYDNAPFVGAKHPANQALQSITDASTIEAIEKLINVTNNETKAPAGLADKAIEKAFNEICEFCENYPNIRGGLPSSDPRALKAIHNLEVIATWLRSKYSKFKGIDLKIKISKGSGAFPTVPWIVLLPPGQELTKGVYVGLCFGNEGAGAVLGCAESSTYPQGLKTIKRTDRGSIPEINVDGRSAGTKYNNVYANPIEIRKGEFDSIKFIKHTEDSLKMALEFISNIRTNIPEIPFKIDTDFAVPANLYYPDELVFRFKSLLLTKPFLILTGLSGSGKSKIAEAFASWICRNPDQQILMVPVGSDWTNRDPLLGYFDSINMKYRKDDYGVINLLLNAEQDPSQPYFLILDEMNLSHVERYFADFLSVMESSKKTIKLYDGILEENEAINGDDEVPSIIDLPRNLFIIGTVNIDETTYMFSPKVLDRAGVIEFRIDRSYMESFLELSLKPDIERISGHGSSMAADFVRIASDISPQYSEKSDLDTELLKFFDQLKSVGGEFGYRAAYEINRFAGIMASFVDDDFDHKHIIDAAIIQKLLPKLHGSRNQLVPVLEKLATLCLKDEKIESVKAKLKMEQLPGNDPDVKYPLSFEKIHRMHSRAIKDGFTSFAEA